MSLHCLYRAVVFAAVHPPLQSCAIPLYNLPPHLVYLAGMSAEQKMIPLTLSHVTLSRPSVLLAIRTVLVLADIGQVVMGRSLYLPRL